MPSSPGSNQSLTLALISDTGGPAASGTTFYYNVGSGGGGFEPTNSLGAGPLAVSRLVQSWNPSDVFAVGDLAYNAGGSTLQDISIGQYYNNFIYPYPSPAYAQGPYLAIDGQPVGSGRKSWPYNIYDYPNGFPNPVAVGAGGSSDQRNHFWGSLGNHDYGQAIGYSQVGVTDYNFDGEGIGQPVGPSSTTSLTSFIDYVVPFLENPDLLGADRPRLNVGAADKSGNRGAYYSITLGGTVEQPLVEFFMLDTERLNINAGFEDWNPSGAKVQDESSGKFSSKVKRDKQFSLSYDPSNPSSEAYAGTTTDPDNGYDQFTWLRQSLENSKAAWKVVTGHHPVYASGRWSDRQPDDHMSLPYMKRLLKALPEGSFDAYYNGHDHYYERVLEGVAGGIGLGIPFITNGNSGRNLSKKIQVPYGTSIYNPSAWDKANKKVEKPEENPNEPLTIYPFDAAPLEVASSALAGGVNGETNNFQNGLYGYGFGATKLEVEEGYLLFKYEEAPFSDPAIANHLAEGVAPDLGSGTDGIASTRAEDWIPDPNGSFKGKSDLAQFKLKITNGVVVGVELLNGGRGYMSSKGGNYVVRGFNIYGNNIDVIKPWEETAQVDLTFAGGELIDVALTSGGKGYELAVQAAANSNTATSTEINTLTADLVVALNYNLNEIQYLVRDETPLYNDWYLIAETVVDSLALELGAFGGMQISLAPSSKKAQDYLASLAITSGYSGTGAQRSYAKPQQGSIRVMDINGTLVAAGVSAPLVDGTAPLQFSRRPAPGAVSVDFGGDALSSYLVNFRAATQSVNLSYGTWSTGISLASPSIITFDQDINLSLVRADSVAAPVSFGFKRNDVSTPSILISAENGASSSALSTNGIFLPSGSGSWLSSESQSLGFYSSALGRMAAGEWVPIALNAAGQELAIQSLQLSGNAIEATFLGGFRALYSTGGTGVAEVVPGSGKLMVTVQRLGAQSNGLAFYEADPITGAVIVNGQSFLPGDAGYLQSALTSAQQDGLILGPNRLPAYGAEVVITDLPLNSQQNYGLLLLRNNSSSELASSYSAANAGGVVRMVSFVAPDRGLYYGIEDMPMGSSDNDFNDLIVGLSSADFLVA